MGCTASYMNSALKSIGLIQLIVFIVFSCSSQEYTTAKLAIQQSDFVKAAEWLPKAIQDMS